MKPTELELFRQWLNKFQNDHEELAQLAYLLEHILYLYNKERDIK